MITDKRFEELHGVSLEQMTEITSRASAAGLEAMRDSVAASIPEDQPMGRGVAVMVAANAIIMLLKQGAKKAGSSVEQTMDILMAGAAEWENK